MKPNGGRESSGELLQLINRDFGSYDTFVKEFKAAAATQFGSGWSWLAYKPEDKKLALVKTPNAENPLVLGYTDAYYLDFQNCPPDYISLFMEKLISWEAVSSRLKAATA
uniref:Manganese/iron superoxide dismutase C-terminal domain-containing protein n=1 Tax=Solanum lycopersicum TaxID=4081 RepID=A0A3Q7GS80_SOLLC